MYPDINAFRFVVAALVLSLMESCVLTPVSGLSRVRVTPGTPSSIVLLLL